MLVYVVGRIPVGVVANMGIGLKSFDAGPVSV